MRPASAWLHMCRDSITIESFASRDSYGDITYGSAVSYTARVVGEQKLVRDFSGNEVVSKHTVLIPSPIVVQPEDRVRLSSSLVNSTQDSALYPPLLGCSRIPDQNGSHHAVLFLG